MKIQRITREHRNDFRAVMVCEHCGHTQDNPNGYHDNYYHTQVIPGMYCESCNRNRAGQSKSAGEKT